ncbi:metallophosphoesterase [Notoacmeibacter ruber]|uniref:Serine/threonine protein phosphatase n=1 Tax=Notoacmeibacter ruber TaxID=2670375 RepID=A0A3L7JC89_9HYPH|nr:metallophosphoesterase [Notoacmeibacter ruber]RLQ88357.1 serine/threonine protein phosphatase [Notoacmeibacter ruber]
MAFTFAVGDIHGEKEKMETLLGKIGDYCDAGTVVFIGDYIDRGPDSAGVLDRLIEGPSDGWRWVILSGNHEIMMLNAISESGSSTDDLPLWLQNGGKATLASYPEGTVKPEHVSFIRGLDLLYRDRHRIYGHAWYDPAVAFEDQQEEMVLWERFSSRDRMKDLAPLHFVHGHTPQASNPSSRGNRTNVDSGAVFGGPLSAAVFDDDQPGPPVDLIQAQ